jgi:hypothetical protein
MSTQKIDENAQKFWDVIVLSLEHEQYLLLFSSMGRIYVYGLRPPTILLFISHIIYEYGAPGAILLTGENRKIRRNICSSVTVYRISYMDLPGHELVPLSERPATNRFSHGTAIASI